jgi:HEAT repeat protein
MTKGVALTLAGAVLLIAASAALLLRNDEPRFKGRTLKDWIRLSHQTSGDPEIREAIIAITTNSVPLLVQRLAANTGWEGRLDARLPMYLRTNTLITPFLFRRRDPAYYAESALRISGTNAACAVPALAELLSESHPRRVQLQAILILCDIGPAALPAMRQAMRSSDHLMRNIAVEAISKMGTNAAHAIPELVAALSDTDYRVRMRATNVLETVAPDALTNSPINR